MAVTVNPQRLTNSNTGYTPTPATGVSSTAGTSENFEFTFPSRDETAYIIVTNGSVASVTVKLVPAASGNGFTPNVLTLATGKVGVFRIESGFVKNSEGKVAVTVTPGASYTVSGSGVSVYGVYSGVLTR